jgi:protein disulfide-isomerase
MKKLCVAIAITMLILPPVRVRAEADVVWLTNFDEAKTLAAKRGVPIMANFSGSDWCGWCIRLEREVFSQPEFADFAARSLVLFVADFPARTAIPEDVRLQNQSLSEKYSIAGFPSVLLLDANGKVVARTGYRPGGAVSYIEHLKGLIQQNAGPAADMEESQ